MTKSICALAHKSGNTRNQFQSYYEEHHAPLAIGYFPFSGYSRNHLTDDGDFGWDTISEFWAHDIQETAALMAGPIGKIMAADEECFMNRSLIASAGVEEIILSEGSRADEEGIRTAILVQDAAPETDLRSVLLDWAGSFARELPGVSIDLVMPWTELAFPAKAVLWLPGWQEQRAQSSSLAVRALRVRHVETPASQLLGNRAKSG